MLDLSIVMPCLNEAETVGTCITKAKKGIEKLGINAEIIIADNGSTDGSTEIAERMGARVVKVRDKGYGNALRGGIEAAQGRWIIMGDADDSYDFTNLAPFVEKLSQGYDLVMGCRLPKGGGKIMEGAMPLKHRWLGNPALSFLGRLFFKGPVSDFHCGLRAFTKAAYQKLGLRTTGMEFASEMVVKSSLQAMKIAEVPIILYRDGRSRPSHLRSWRDGWRHLRFMLLYCPTWLFVVPGLILLLGGTIFGLRLWWGPLQVGFFLFDTNTLLVCSMSVAVGLQIFFFGLFTRVFAISEGWLPKTISPMDNLYKLFSLERGVLLGLLIFMAGLVKLVMATFYWKEANFGVISYPESLRMVIPAVTLMVIGVQIIFSSFFLSILDLPRK